MRVQSPESQVIGRIQDRKEIGLELSRRDIARPPTADGGEAVVEMIATKIGGSVPADPVGKPCKENCEAQQPENPERRRPRPQQPGARRQLSSHSTFLSEPLGQVRAGSAIAYLSLCKSRGLSNG